MRRTKGFAIAAVLLVCVFAAGCAHLTPDLGLDDDMIAAGAKAYADAAQARKDIRAVEGLSDAERAEARQLYHNVQIEYNQFRSILLTGEDENGQTDADTALADLQAAVTALTNFRDSVVPLTLP